MGIVSALGKGVEQQLNALRSKKTGIRKITHLKTIHTETTVAGEIPVSNAGLASSLNIIHTDAYSRSALLGMLAAREAWHQARFDAFDTRKTGFINATTVGAMSILEDHYFSLIQPELEDAYKIYLGELYASDHTEHIAGDLGVKGPVTTISTACSSSANAVIHGARLIRHGYIDRAICGGTDALARFTLNGFISMKIVDPELCKPFDQNRRGLNLGEGAAYVCLESEASVRETGNMPLAELKSYSNVNEAFHATASSPEGEGAYQAMFRSLEMAGLKPGDIQYINAHGTATENNDFSEAVAIRKLFGAIPPDFSSTKCYTGHTFAAAGAIEAVFSILAIQHGLKYPALNFSEPIENIGIRPLTELKEAQAVDHVLSNSFGFGGNNTSLLFSKI